jgi:hypothetical protein
LPKTSIADSTAISILKQFCSVAFPIRTETKIRISDAFLFE